jgi:hypothetical protein
MQKPQEEVDQKVERLFGDGETLGSEGDFCIIPDGRIVSVIRFPIGIEANVVAGVIGIEPVETIVVVLTGVVPDILILVEAVERSHEGMASGGAGSFL